MVICLGRGVYLHMAQLMPLPLTFLAQVNPDWFYQNGSVFLVPAYPGCPGKKRPLNRCSVVVVVVVIVEDTDVLLTFITTGSGTDSATPGDIKFVNWSGPFLGHLLR